MSSCVDQSRRGSSKSEYAVEIRTARLLLRPATTDDLPAFHSILRDPRATAFWSTPPHDSVEETGKWLRAMIEIPHGEGEDFVVEHEGRVIGKAGFYRFPEIGFIFHPDIWGRGFASEALCAVLAGAFAVYKLQAVNADVDPRNGASLQLLSRLGFRETGRRERAWLVGELWCDSVDLRLEQHAFKCAQDHSGGRVGLPSGQLGAL